MFDVEQREAARQFILKWRNKGKEDEDDRSYWLDILERIMGMEDATDHVEFQKKVIVDGHTKRIDAYIRDTRVLIEQKSLGIKLDKKGHQSGGIELTPYEQAKRYNDNLPFDEKARWIVTSNFEEIWIYDMNARVPEPLKVRLEELQTNYTLLNFLVKQDTKKLNKEMEVSLKAGELVGALYDSLLNQYENPNDEDALKSLNKLCVRIVFCLYAEDAGIFGKKDLFHDYFEQLSVKDSRKGLRELFSVLNQKVEERDKYLKDDNPLLASFPYVNGGLFADNDIEIPPITEEIREIILDKASYNFDWSQISPTIFGAVFESTLNPETRRSGGMHYTSIENIHKVIDPLFLNELQEEFDAITALDVIRTKKTKLENFQNKLASLKWLDPACGSGNFLTETYISIRRLENKVIYELGALEKGNVAGQKVLAFDEASPIKVSISQFYGIEINDFAVTVAKTALWIAESQMMKETEDIVHMSLDFLPLKTNAYIVEGNALRIDWEDVVSKYELSYIMGNPPFIGHQYRNKEQVADMDYVFTDFGNYGKLDYVSAWYKKAADYMSNTKIKTALVSTNSIVQGESVATMWEPLFVNYGLIINFAHNTFRWDSEASIKAHVHCVIIGFSLYDDGKQRLIYQGGNCQCATNINGYLLDAPNVFIKNRGKLLTTTMPKMSKGSQPTDGGNLLLSIDEMQELVSKEPETKKWIHRFMMGDDYINNKKRYCLWMVNANPAEIKKCPSVLHRIENVRELRLKSPTKSVQRDAETPTLFTQRRQPNSQYLVIPRVSSERRRYIPMGFLEPDIIAGDKLQFIEGASLELFGILISNVHMAWMRIVAGRLKSDYSYSPAVYNNFPFPNLNQEQRTMIEKTAQDILAARALYPDSSLADLYDPLTMPPELSKAHKANDIAVMKAYGFDVNNTSESDCVAKLMEMYQKLVEK